MDLQPEPVARAGAERGSEALGEIEGDRAPLGEELVEHGLGEAEVSRQRRGVDRQSRKDVLAEDLAGMGGAGVAVVEVFGHEGGAGGAGGNVPAKNRLDPDSVRN